MSSTNDRIHELESKVAELTALVDTLSTPPARAGTRAGTVADMAATMATAADPPTTSSRRGMLKLAGAATAGAVAAAATRALPAAAADTNPLTASGIVETTSSTRLPTGLVYTNALGPQVAGALFGSMVNSNLFIARDTPSVLGLGDPSASSSPAAVAGYSYRTVANGVYGYTAMAGSGVVGLGTGTGSTGVYAQGTRANIELKAIGTAPGARTDPHVLGELVCDLDGNLWGCTVAGTPGTWRKITGAAAAGAFHALSPGRVFDSRAAQPAQGPIARPQTRTISVADKRDPTTGAVTLANFVPAGATAVAANVTVVSIAGSGFLTMNPGGNTAVESSTINWSAAGQILANGVILTLNTTRQLTVVAGGAGGSTEFLVDVTGYFL